MGTPSASNNPNTERGTSSSSGPLTEATGGLLHCLQILPPKREPESDESFHCHQQFSENRRIRLPENRHCQEDQPSPECGTVYGTTTWVPRDLVTWKKGAGGAWRPHKADSGGRGRHGFFTCLPFRMLTGLGDVGRFFTL